nr:immunoglobulin heavy chain junction region [Macaca mulatta]
CARGYCNGIHCYEGGLDSW